MSLNLYVRFLSEITDHEISVDRSLTVLQLKELLRQLIPFFQRFSTIPTEVFKLSLEGFDGVMEDGRPLSAYPLTEERHPVLLLALERSVEKIGCSRCQKPFVQWSSDRLCCGDEREVEGGEEVLEKRKARIPQLLNCGHSVCLECWREDLVVEEEAMADEKEFVLVDPSLLTEEGLERQNRMALETALEKARRKREREKAENVWKFVCCEKNCGVVTYWRKDQERSCHRGMQRLVHQKKREWVEAERARGRCFIKTCGAEAMFLCSDCGDTKYCITHFRQMHQAEDMSDHVPQVLLSSQVHPSISGIFKTRFCCYCGDGETASSCVRGGGRPHCEHRDAGLVSARVMMRAGVMEQLAVFENLQAECWRQLVTWNGVMEQLQEHRVKGVERIRKEFDDLISRLEARKEAMVTELGRCYREKEMELVEKMEALGMLSGELEAGLVHHRQPLTELTSVSGGCGGCGGGGGIEVCIVRDVVDVNAVQERMSQLASEGSRESLARFSEISMEFEGCEAQEEAVEEFCRFAELASNRVTPTQPKLSKKQKCLELEQRVAVLTQELNVATTALSASVAREAALRAEFDQVRNYRGVVETSQPKVERPKLTQTTSGPKLKGEAKATNDSQTVNMTATADSKNTVETQPALSQTSPQRLPVASEESLLEAARLGSLEDVEYSVSNGVNMNCKNKYVETPLHLSARDGRLEVVQYLLQQGAYINCQANGGYTPLHLSAHYGHLEVATCLLQQGADKTIKNRDGQTAYDVVTRGSKDIQTRLRNLLTLTLN